jgi:TP901 family phage tail tape measure protein
MAFGEEIFLEFIARAERFDSVATHVIERLDAIDQKIKTMGAGAPGMSSFARALQTMSHAAPVLKRDLPVVARAMVGIRAAATGWSDVQAFAAGVTQMTAVSAVAGPLKETATAARSLSTATKGYGTAVDTAIKKSEALPGVLQGQATAYGNVAGQATAATQATAAQAKLSGRLSSSNKKLAATTKQVGEAQKATTLRHNQGADGLLKLMAAQARYLAGGLILFGVLDKLRDGFSRVTDASAQLGRVYTVFKKDIDEVAGAQGRLSELMFRSSSELGLSTKEVSDAIFEIGSAGKNLETAMATLQPVLDIATATNADLTATTRTVIGVFNVFEDQLGATASEADKMRRIVDVMGKTYQLSQVELSDLIQGLKFSSQSARSAGFDFEFTAAAISVFNNNMLRSGFAGRGLRVLLDSLVGKADKVKETFGVTFTPGDIPSFISLLEIIDARLSSADTTLVKSTLADLTRIFGIRGATAVKLLADQVKALTFNFDEMSNSAAGTAEELRDIRLDTLSAQMNILSESTTNLIAKALTPMGAALAGTLRPINAATQGILAADEATDGWALGIVGVATSLGLVGAAVEFAAGSKTLLKIKSVESAALGAQRATALWGTSMGVTGGLAKGLGGAIGLLVSPVGLLLGSIVALGGAYLLWQKHQERQTQLINENVIATEKELAVTSERVELLNELSKATVQGQRARAQTLIFQLREINTLRSGSQALELDLDLREDQIELLQKQARAQNALAAAAKIEAARADFEDDERQWISLTQAILRWQDRMAGARAEGEELQEQMAQNRAEAERLEQATGDNAVKIQVLDRVYNRMGNNLAWAAERFDEATRSVWNNRQALIELSQQDPSVLERYTTLYGVQAQAVIGTTGALNRLAEAQEAKRATDIAEQEAIARTTELMKIQTRVNDNLTSSLQKSSDVRREITQIRADRATDISLRLLQDEESQMRILIAAEQERTRLQLDGIKEREDAVIAAHDRTLEQFKREGALAIATGKDQIEVYDEFESKRIALASDTSEKLHSLGAERVQARGKELQAMTALENEAYQKVLGLEQDLASARQSTENLLRDQRLARLDEEEQFGQIQVEIKRLLQETAGASALTGPGLEKANEALQEAQRLLGQMPDQVRDASGQIILTQEEAADEQERLARLIALANEDLARGQLLAAQAAQTRAAESATAADKEGGALDQAINKLTTLDEVLKTAVASVNKEIQDSFAATNAQIPELETSFEELGGTAVSKFAVPTREKVDELNTALSETEEILRRIAEQMGGTGQFGPIPMRSFGGATPPTSIVPGPGGDVVPVWSRVNEVMIPPEISMMYGSRRMSRIIAGKVPPHMLDEPVERGDVNILQLTPEFLKQTKGRPDDEVIDELHHVNRLWEQERRRRKGVSGSRARAR